MSPLRPFALAALALGACRSPGEPERASEHRPIDLPDSYAALPVEPAGGAVLDGWIADLGDPRLEVLVREALGHNADLQRAAARVQLAEALARRAGAARSPSLDGYADASREDAGPPGLGEQTRLAVGVRASWEADLWGRLARQERAAGADARASALDYVAARRALAASTARNWFLALGAARTIEIDERSLEQRQRVERITGARVEVGDAPQNDLDLAVGQSANARAAREEDQRLLDSNLLGLEYLVGRYPKGELAAEGLLPRLDAPAPAGLPSELLERRPDVRAAAERVAAAFDRERASEVARLPRLSLTASGGKASEELGDLLDASSTIWSLGAGLLAPIYSGGRWQAEVDVRRAEREAALADYLVVARSAFLEVERSLSAEASLRERTRELALAAERLGLARERTEELYAAGETTLLALDQVHDRLYQTERNLVAASTELVLQRIALHLALGGDFEIRP